MQDYFNRKSRAPSPALNQASRLWYSAPPVLQDYNQVIIDTFIRIFQRHVTVTFPIFRDASSETNYDAACTLALAAVGGLFSTVAGSNKVARSMYNDARRLLLAFVGFHV